MEILIGLLLVLAIVFVVLAWVLPQDRLRDAALACTVAAVALAIFGGRL